MNKKYEGLDESFYETEKPSLIDRICEAKRALGGVSLAIVIGGVALGSMTGACLSNTPTVHVCPFTKAITTIFGYEAGLQHHAHDLERYGRKLEDSDSTLKASISGVEYVPEEIRYYAPNGGILTQDEAGEMVVEQTIPATVTTVVGEDGKECTTYSVPAGYSLQGSVGVKRSEPMKVENQACINFEYSCYDGEDVVTYYDGTWTYQDGEYMLQKEHKGMSR